MGDADKQSKVFRELPRLNLQRYLTLQRACHIGSVGVSGSGKSYAMIQLMKQLPKPVVCITDGQDSQFDEFDQLDKPSDLLKWAPAKNTGNISVFGGYDQDSAMRIYDYVFAVRPCTLYIDEAGLFCRTKLPEKISKMLFQGRKVGHHVLWSATRPQEVMSSLRSGSIYIMAFRLEEENDIKAVSMRKSNLTVIPNLDYQNFIIAKGTDDIFLAS